MNQMQFTLGPTTVTGALDVVGGSPDGHLDTRGFCGTICFEVSNTGAAALNDFTVEVQAHPDGDWHEMLDSPDWTDPTINNMVFASTDLALLAGSAKGLAMIRVRGARGVRFKGGTAAGNAILTILGSLTQDQG
jgi:hypothetical protein